MNHRPLRTVLLCLLATAIPASILHAQEGHDKLAAPSIKLKTTRLKKLRETEAYLLEMKSLTDAELKGRSREFEVAGAFLHLGNSLSLIGDQEAAIEAINSQIQLSHEMEKKQGLAPSLPYKMGDEKLVSGAESENILVLDAISEIVKQAKNRQIIMLNEAHHLPMHRAFAMKLAKELKRIGYTYLACEAFSPWDEKPLAKKYVSDAMGLYTLEPMFANFINSAIEDEWKLISYEAPTATRELDMAKNLMEKIFKKDPNAKVFVYAGYGHIYKHPEANSKPKHAMMAAQLKMLSGIDPFVIEQTQMSPIFQSKQQQDMYKKVQSRFKITKPSVLATKSGHYVRLGIQQKVVDMQVVYPHYRLDKVTHREAWLESIAEFKPKDIPINLLPKNGVRLVYAYRQDDPLDATPIDLVLVDVKKPLPKLMLPAGQFRFATED